MFSDLEDTEGLVFFHGEEGVFSWAPNQPDNGVEESCAVMQFTLSNDILVYDGLLHDFPYSANTDLIHGFICESEVNIIDTLNPNENENIYKTLRIIVFCFILSFIIGIVIIGNKE